MIYNKYEELNNAISSLDKTKLYIVYFENKKKLHLVSQIIRFGAYLKYRKRKSLNCIVSYSQYKRVIRPLVNHVGFICSHDTTDNSYSDTIIIEATKKSGLDTSRLYDIYKKFKGNIILEECGDYNQESIDLFLDKYRETKYSTLAAVGSWFNFSKSLKTIGEAGFCSDFVCRYLLAIGVQIKIKEGDKAIEITPSDLLFSEKHKDGVKINNNLYLITK